MTRQIILMPRKPLVFLVTMLYLLLGIFLTHILLTLSEPGQMFLAFNVALLEYSQSLSENLMILETVPFPTLEFIPFTPLGFLFFVLPFVFSWVIGLGYTIYSCIIIKGENAGFSSLLEGFNFFLKIVLIRLVYAIIFIGSFALFIVPSIIAMCAFSQVNYLLIDHPEKNIFWHFSESVRIMRGKKWDYFKLRFSFIGWILLSSIGFIRYAVWLWLHPYTTFTLTSYYYDLTGQSPTSTESQWQKPGMF